MRNIKIRKMTCLAGWGLFCLAFSGCSVAETVYDFAEEQYLERVDAGPEETGSDEVSGTDNSREKDQRGTDEYSQIDTSDRYYYSTLSEDEQAIYEDFSLGLMNHEDNLILDSKDGDRLYEIYQMVLADYPEMFWVGSGYSYTSMLMNTKVVPEYNCTIAEMKANQAKVDQATEEALQTLRDNDLDSDYQKVKAVYTYVIHTVDYNTESTDNQNLLSSLVNHESVCAGYSRETQYLLQQLGVQAIYVTGEVTGVGSHAWNIVRCDGKYYEVDSTFGDCAFQDASVKESMPKGLLCDYNYLCCSDAQLLPGRTVNSLGKLPSCDSEDLDYYRQIGRYYDAFDDTLIRDMENCILDGGEYWTCQFSNEDAYKDFLGEVQNSYYLQEVLDLLGKSQVKGYCTYNEAFHSVSCWYE